MAKKRRTCTPEFKFRVVMELVTGQKRPMELCREHQLAESTLSCWRQEFQERGPEIFASDGQGHSQEQVRIAELERMIGRLTLELPCLTCLPSTRRRQAAGRSGTYPVRLLCDVVDVAPSSYYYVLQGGDDLALLSLIEEVLLQFPTYGYRRVTVQLQRDDHQVNHKRVLPACRQAGG